MAKEKQGNEDILYQYTPQQRLALEQHIEDYFGPISFFLSQPVNKDIKLDIAVIEPNIERKHNFYMLVTIGLGAYKMKRSKDAPKDALDRCELVMMLNPDFKIPSNDQDHYWPIQLLKDIAHLPFQTDCFLDWGFCYKNLNGNFSSGTNLRYALLSGLNRIFDSISQVVYIDNDMSASFYWVMPLYHSEYELLLETAQLPKNSKCPISVSTNVLTNFVSKISYADSLVSNKRSDSSDGSPDYFATVCEDVQWHSFSIKDNKLDVDPINAVNHIAILFRYMFENQMIASFIVDNFSDEDKDIILGKSKTDLRQFLIERFNGIIDRRICNAKGLTFLNQYYNMDPKVYPRFASDIDSYALRSLGVKKYFSKKLHTDGYLFVNYNDSYYNNMKAVIEQRLISFSSQKSYPKQKDADNAYVISKYLNCDTTFFPSLRDDTPIKAKLNCDYRYSATKEFIPVLIETSEAFIKIAYMFVSSMELPRSKLKKVEKSFGDSIKSQRIAAEYSKKFSKNTSLISDSVYIQAARNNAQKQFDFRENISALILEGIYNLVSDDQYAHDTCFSMINLLANYVCETLNVKDISGLKSYLHQPFNQIKDLLTEDVASFQKYYNSSLISSIEGYERASICLGPLNNPENIELSSYWERPQKTKPLVEALIPVNDPCDVIRYMAGLHGQMVGVRQNTLVFLADVFWKFFRAIPAVFTEQGIEFISYRPFSKSGAKAIAAFIVIFGDYLPLEERFKYFEDLYTQFSFNLVGKTSFFLPLATSL